MRIAQIINNKVHWIFEAESIPNWPPDPEGNPTVLIDITDYSDISEGWLYDGKNFIEPETIIIKESEVISQEPTQLDRIEAAVLQSKQEIIDGYTLELLETGAL